MDLGSIWAELRFRTNKLQEDLTKAEAQIKTAQTKMEASAASFEKSGKAIKGVGKGLSMYLTLPLVVAAGASVKFGLDFSKSIGYANTMLKLSGPALNQFKQGVLKVSDQWGKSATDVAQSAYSISSVLHTSGKDTVTILNQTARAAKAGQIQTVDATNAVVRMMSIYNLKASQSKSLIDTLSATVKAGNANWQDLAHVLPQDAGSAKILGVKLDELSAAFATMSSKSGSSEEAGASLRAMLMSFIKPSDDMKKALKDMGYNSAQLAIKQIGLKGVMDALRKKYGDNAEALGKLIPNIRGITGASILFANKGKDFAESLDMIRNSSNETAKQIEAGRTTYQKFTESLNRVKNAGIELFASFEPYFVKALDSLTKLAKKFESLSPSAKKTVLIVGALLAIIGPLLVVAGTLIGSMQKIKLAFVALNAILPMTGTLASAALGPIGLAIMAIVVAVAVLAVAWKRDWGGIREKTKAFLEFFKGVGKTIGEKIGIIKNSLVSMGDKAKSAFETSKNNALSFANKMVNIVKTIREKIPLINAYFKIWEFGLNLLSNLFEKFKKKVESVLSNLGDKIKIFFNDMRDKGKSWADKQSDYWSEYDKSAQQYYGVVGKATDEYYVTFNNKSKKAKDTEVANQKQISNTTLRIRKETIDQVKNLTQKQIDDELKKMQDEQEQKARQDKLNAEKQKYLAAKTADEKASVQKEVDQLMDQWEYEDQVKALQKRKELLGQETQAKIAQQQKELEVERQAQETRALYEQKAEQQFLAIEQRKVDLKKNIENGLVEYLRDIHEREAEQAITAIEKKRNAALDAVQDEMTADYNKYTNAVNLINMERDAKLGVINKEITDLQARHEQEQRDEWMANESKRMANAKTAEERASIQKEIDKRLAEWAYENKLSSLRAEAEKVRENAQKQADDKKKDYEKEKTADEKKLEDTKQFYSKKIDTTKKYYADLMTERQLDAEAQKILATKTMNEILAMLNGTKSKWAKLGAEIGDTFWSNLMSSIKDVKDLAKLIGALPSLGGGGGLGGLVHLANGGNIYGPTLALIGENASSSNPEIVIPPSGKSGNMTELYEVGTEILRQLRVLNSKTVPNAGTNISRSLKGLGGNI